MKHAILFLTAAFKDVPTSICDSQLAAIEAVRAIFTNGKTIKSIPHKKLKAPLIPRQAVPEQYRSHTSKGGQETQPSMTSKGAIQQTLHTITKKNITMNSADDQEPISRRTKSSRSIVKLQPTQTIQNTSEPIANRTRSS